MNKKTKILNRQNNELDKKVSKENSIIMTDMVCYLRGANISEYNQEAVRQDLLQMFLSSQERGEDIKTTIGEDYQSFCDEVIEALPKQTIKERILGYVDIILLGTAILGAIDVVISKETIMLIRNLIIGQPADFGLSVTVSSLLSYIFVVAAAFLIVQIICKNSLKPKRKPNKVKNFIMGGLIGGSIMAVFLLIAWFGRQTLFTVNIFVVCVLSILFYVAHKILQKVI